MKNFATIGQRYCPARQQNVPLEIWWEDDGSRREQCLHQDGCGHRDSYANHLSPPCGHFDQTAGL